MKKVIPPVLLTLMVTLGVQDRAAAHCEVPCGIYGDQARFAAMLEDTRTITKAMDQIHALTKEPSAQSHNQLARWVANKESHATRIQHTIAQYFMAQRIKPGKGKDYVIKLVAAHRVMVDAMRCKQSVEVSRAKELKDAIARFYEAYEGKKFGGEHGAHEHGAQRDGGRK